MPGFLLHVGATVMCTHGGKAQPTSASLQVFVGGQAVVLQPSPFSIVACPFNVSGAPSPCATAQWTTAATRITSHGMPILLIDSRATCIPNGTPVVITVTQNRVTGI